MLRAELRHETIPQRTPGHRRTVVLLLVLALVACAGCQPKTSLHGTVSYNGEPVEKGSVTFLSNDGKGRGFGAQVRDGSYDAEKIELGKHIAVVRGIEKSGPISKDESIRQREQRNNPHGLAIDYIAEDATGNSQTVDVVGGEQVLDFVLQGPPRSE